MIMMTLFHKRKSVRLKEYDYSTHGGYFVTICTKNRECFLGEISDGVMEYSIIGETAEKYFIDTVEAVGDMYLDSYVIMPNHIHMILFITDNKRSILKGVSRNAPTEETDHSQVIFNAVPKCNRRGVTCNARDKEYYSKIASRNSLLSITIRKFKAHITRWCNNNQIEYFGWQRNYYEHVIRNEDDLHKIRFYIESNPYNWHMDDENPDNLNDMKN